MKYFLLFTIMLTSVALAETTAKTIAEFKGDCFRMNGTLKFEEGQWVCVAKKQIDGLVSLPLYLPK
jgi:hypothetical protein